MEQRVRAHRGESKRRNGTATGTVVRVWQTPVRRAAGRSTASAAATSIHSQRPATWDPTSGQHRGGAIAKWQAGNMSAVHSAHSPCRCRCHCHCACPCRHVAVSPCPTTHTRRHSSSTLAHSQRPDPLQRTLTRSIIHHLVARCTMPNGEKSASHTQSQSLSQSSSADGDAGRAWPTLAQMSAETANVGGSTASTDSDAGSDESDSETHRSSGVAAESPNEAETDSSEAAAVAASSSVDASRQPGESMRQSGNSAGNKAAGPRLRLTASIRPVCLRSPSFPLQRAWWWSTP